MFLLGVISRTFVALCKFAKQWSPIRRVRFDDKIISNRTSRNRPEMLGALLIGCVQTQRFFCKAQRGAVRDPSGRVN